MLVVIKGAGDLASGIALRLFHARFSIIMTEIAAPLAVRRTVCFSQAVYDGVALVEDVRAVLVKDDGAARDLIAKGAIPVFIDPPGETVKRFKPDAVVDAIMAKKNTGTAIHDAPIVIAIGPGFNAGADCHGVIETQRGHSLGRLITRGNAVPNTGIPGNIGGFTTERLLRSPADGIFEARAEIGDPVKSGGTVAMVNGEPVKAEIDGILRGLLPSGIKVIRGMKAGDVDPRCERSHCFTVSDKALAIGGGVLEGLLSFQKNTKGSGYLLNRA
jgi:xanthine dehydrogenase accessory factor